MSKKMLAAAFVSALIFTTSAPVYAQSVSPSPVPTAAVAKPGFFGEIERFFSNLFHHHTNSSMGSIQSTPNQPVVSGQAPSGFVQKPSGTPDSLSMQQWRLERLVHAGKITQAQADAIIAELEKVQSELKSWADSQGIDESYVLGSMEGPMGIGGGLQENRTTVNGQSQGQTFQYKRHMMGGQGQSVEGGSQGGGVPPGAPQGQGE